MFSKNKKRNILVLGNNGMLGHELYETLIQLSSNKHSNIGTVIGVDVKDGIDLTKRYALSYYFTTSIHFDYCINCVAYTDTKAAESTKEGRTLDYKLNALAPKYIAESCKYWKTKLIHVSTDYVFSENSTLIDVLDSNNVSTPFKPNDELFPCSIYGYDKLIGEMNIKEAFGNSSKDYAILRTSWIYSMHNSKSFIHKFLRNVASKLKTEPNAEITMTCNEMSVPTSVQYLIDCIRDVIDNKRHGIFHAVPLFEHAGVTRYEFAQAIIEMLCDSAVDLTKYAVNGKTLANVKLLPVEYDGYQPKYSAMQNTHNSATKNCCGIGSNMFWKDDLKRFMNKNAIALLKEMTNQI